MWKQVGQVQRIIVVVFRDSGQHIDEPFAGIYIAGLTASQQRVHHGHIFRCIMIATEQEVLSAKSQGPDRILDPVVVDLVSAIQVIPG